MALHYKWHLEKCIFDPESFHYIIFYMEILFHIFSVVHSCKSFWLHTKGYSLSIQILNLYIFSKCFCLEFFSSLKYWDIL